MTLKFKDENEVMNYIKEHHELIEGAADAKIEVWHPTQQLQIVVEHEHEITFNSTWAEFIMSTFIVDGRTYNLDGVDIRHFHVGDYIQETFRFQPKK